MILSDSIRRSARCLFGIVKQTDVASNNCLARAAWILSFFAVATVPAFAQKEAAGADWKIVVGAGAVQCYVIDNKFSSVPYSGAGWQIGGGIQYRKEKWFHELAARYAKSKLKMEKTGDGSDQSYVDGSYLALHSLGSTGQKRLTYQVGGSIQFLFAERTYEEFINNKVSFDFATSVSGLFHLSFAFDKDLKGFSISDRIFVPLVSLVVQPAFDSEQLPGELDGGGSGGFASNSDVLSFGSFTRLKNELSLDMEISPGHELSLIYIWDYYQTRKQRKVQQATHGVALTYTISLF